MENIKIHEKNAAALIRGATSSETSDVVGVYHIECVDAEGNSKWTDETCNLVVDQGKNGMLDTYFAGSAYTATWYMSLITAGAPTATSTYAVPTVTEITTGVVNGNTRPTVGWSAAASGTKTATTATFAITGSATITGNMLVTGANTVGDTAATGGILFSSGTFTAGSKLVSSGDTLNVTYSISI